MGKTNLYGKVSAILAIVVSVIAIICTSKGIWDRKIYGDLLSLKIISENLYYGSIAQDIIIASSVSNPILLVCIFSS